MISAYLIMDEARLSDAQASAARSVGADWQIVNARNGRQIVNAIAPAEMVQPLLTMLAAYHPSLVGVWGIDGFATILDPASFPAFVDAMPDVAPGVRPTEPADIVQWAGWVERVFA